MKKTYWQAGLILIAAGAASGMVQAQSLSKEQKHARMAELQAEIVSLRTNQGSRQAIDLAQAELEQISASMGGDLPGATSRAPGGSVRAAPLPPPNGAYVTTTSSNNTPVAINDVATNTSQINVTGAGAVLWDLDLNVSITHTFAADMDITLTSPAGTVVTISTDNGAGNDNVFNGSLFDDQAGTPVTDTVFTNLVTATPLVAEGPLDAFRGEDPNGTWTLTVVDDLAGDIGSIDAWSLTTSALAAAPAEVTTAFSNAPALAILDVATVSDTITVSGALPYLTDISMLTNITHTFAADMDITLTSPAGTVVTISTDNGAGNDDVFNGTDWRNDAQDPVTDHVYANATLASPLSAEESLGAFLGEDPNGIWTLTITDDLAGDTGTLANWTLNISSGQLGAPQTPVPTLSTWSLVAMAGLLFGFAMFWRRRAQQ